MHPQKAKTPEVEHTPQDNTILLQEVVRTSNAIAERVGGLIVSIDLLQRMAEDTPQIKAQVDALSEVFAQKKLLVEEQKETQNLRERLLINKPEMRKVNEKFDELHKRLPELSITKRVESSVQNPLTDFKREFVVASEDFKIVCARVRRDAEAVRKVIKQLNRSMEGGLAPDDISGIRDVFTTNSNAIGLLGHSIKWKAETIQTALKTLPKLNEIYNDIRGTN